MRFLFGTISGDFIDKVKSMTMIDNLPLYYAQITTDDDGIFCMSLVGSPAVKSNFLTFAKHDNKRDMVRMTAIEDGEKRLLLGVIMRADFPIYRNDDGIEYYLAFDAPTLRRMAEKMLADGRSTTVTIQHNGKLVEGVHLQELFIKDTSKGISPKGFEDIEEGSLFGVYKVLNDDVWDMVKRGECKGFSLEGYFHHKIKHDELKHLMAEVEEIEKLIAKLDK